MGTFLDAMDASQPTHTLGENASLELTAEGVGEARTALFAALVRKCPDERVAQLAEAVVIEAKGDVAALADLAVLAFQTRDCRGGKGERGLFSRLVWELLARFPEATLALIPLIPEYGSWRDLVVLWEAIGATDASVPAAARSREASFRGALVKEYARALTEDLEALKAERKPASLAAKYAPREGGQFAAFGKELARALFPADAQRKKAYRKAMVALCASLDVPEQKMCGKRWAEIEVSGVPSRCLAKSRKAFLNEKLKRSGALSKAEDITGDRHPDDADRVQCRKNIREALVKKGLKGKQLFPHELVKSTINGQPSTLEDDVANAQWAAIMADLKTQLAEAGGSDLGKLVALVDVSGSMSGTPMEVAIALGLIVADVAAAPFKDRVMTFEAEPKWHALPATAAPTERIRNLKRAPWGMNTNFALALERILDACEASKVPAEDVPGLIVFSDMQFDQAATGHGAWKTHHERLEQRFREAGYEMPPITYWNIRGDTKGGFMAEADKPGVRLLSGFSPALLKLILTGEEEAEETVVVNKDGTTTVVKAQPTPYSTMRKALDAARYDAVRAVLAAQTAGAFAAYAFAPAEDATVAGDDFEMVEAGA